MSLLASFITLLNLWRPEFCKQKLFERIRALGIGFLGVVHRKTLTQVRKLKELAGKEILYHQLFI